ncbi:hypothetical protein DSAG12_00292 [Promethearchaeum syntrophicum]|uniref:Uncharacterized protein n=1 Tax=Promethearchaeum syntrophicum TaxID=2594042 RepID=A0A5B9D5S9_9ARCH|nr:hypothetical protein [Candidatus Prometheoarchaeum syntrophicum]QEE14479.1 hypothetical protein DSAG12_00292 [Candidatus Prometheoarchaeum syntrophicum]
MEQENKLHRNSAFLDMDCYKHKFSRWYQRLFDDPDSMYKALDLIKHIRSKLGDDNDENGKIVFDFMSRLTRARNIKDENNKEQEIYENQETPTKIEKIQQSIDFFNPL